MRLKVRLLSRANLPSRANQIAELELGELVKDPHFTLFESVGALEVSNIVKLCTRDQKLK
jgi:hypothetical protein